jgi:hypothetical protein
MGKLTVYVSAGPQASDEATRIADEIEASGHVVPIRQWMKRYEYLPSMTFARDTLDAIGGSDVFVAFSIEPVATCELGVAISAARSWGKPYVIALGGSVQGLPLAPLANRSVRSVSELQHALEAYAREVR